MILRTICGLSGIIIVVGTAVLTFYWAVIEPQLETPSHCSSKQAELEKVK